MLRRVAVLPAAASIALALAQTAAGATVATTRACLNSRSSAQFVGAGFAPGTPVEVNGAEIIGVSGVAGPDGTFSAPFTAPLGDVTKPPTPFTFQASDGTNVAMGSALLAQPGVTVAPYGPTRVQLRIRLAGYEPGRRVYAHLRWSHRWRRTTLLGTAAAPCGTLDVKRKLLRKTATRRPRDVYVQFDASRTPATDTHQTAYARFTVIAGVRARPERYRLVRHGWRERTGI